METIKFKNEDEFFLALECSTPSGYREYKEEKLSGFDSEKGFVDVTAYIQRVSDGKKFIALYTRGGQGDRWTDDLEFTEVPQRKKEVNSITWEKVLSELNKLPFKNYKSFLTAKYNPPTYKRK